MKINSNYVLREVAGTWVVLPISKAAVDFNGMISLNETASFLWRCLEKDTTIEQLTNTLIQKYDVNKSEAIDDIEAFVEKLRSIGAIEY